MSKISPSQQASIDQYNRWQDDKDAYMARNHPETLKKPVVQTFTGYEENGKRFYNDPLTGEKRDWPEEDIAGFTTTIVLPTERATLEAIQKVKGSLGDEDTVVYLSEESTPFVLRDLVTIPNHSVALWDLIGEQWVNRTTGTPEYEYSEFEDVTFWSGGKHVGTLRVKRAAELSKDDACCQTAERLRP